MIQFFELIKKDNLTNNVFEMVFKSEKEIKMIPGQFITFLIEWIWWRAYSILKLKNNEIKLIIKKREKSEWWRWWSIFLCDLNVWDKVKWIWPAWHFTYKETNENKMFIWTWTGLVPLYNMIKHILKNNSNIKVKMIFWVRLESDVFYLKQLHKLKEKHKNFSFQIYISRVKDLYEFKKANKWEDINSWYATNYFSDKKILHYKEFYICWAPQMIESTVEKLEKFWFKKDKNIFFEKY